MNFFAAQFADAVALVASSTTFGPGTGPIFLNGVSCRGNETNLADCPHDGIGILGEFCVHSNDGGVACPQGVVTYCRSTSMCSFN